MTSSCHRCLGLPTGLVPIGVQSNSFPVGLAWSILWICPSRLILCAIMNLTISAPSVINLHVISYSPYIVNIDRTKYFPSCLPFKTYQTVRCTTVTVSCIALFSPRLLLIIYTILSKATCSIQKMKRHTSGYNDAADLSE